MVILLQHVVVPIRAQKSVQLYEILRRLSIPRERKKKVVRQIINVYKWNSFLNKNNFPYLSDSIRLFLDGEGMVFYGYVHLRSIGWGQLCMNKE